MLVLLPVGETVGDVEKILVGQTETVMTDDGLDDINSASQMLCDYPFVKVYSSDAYTAQDVLRAVLRANPHNMSHELVEELRERSGGSYEGLPYTNIRKGMSPKQYRVWDRDPFEAPLHGESLVDVEERIRPWFDETIKSLLCDNEPVLIISHPDTIKVLSAIMRGDKLMDVMGIKIEAGIPYFHYGIPK